MTKLEAAVTCLAADLRLLQTGEWEPDEESIQASLDNAELLERNMPTLLEAVELLKKLHDECHGDALGTLQAPTWTTACQVATYLHNLKFPNADQTSQP